MTAAGNDRIGIPVFAADAGMQGISFLRAGGLSRAGFIGMFQRVKLLIGSVAAALTPAGVVGIPAGFGAGGSLRGVVEQVMVQRCQPRIGGVAAAGAGVVGVPAIFRAGGGLRGMVEQVVVQSCQLRIGGVATALTPAGVVGVPAGFGAGGGLRGVVEQVMFKRCQLRIGGVVAAIIQIGRASCRERV